jgi:hypothetical protein
MHPGASVITYPLRPGEFVLGDTERRIDLADAISIAAWGEGEYTGTQWNVSSDAL